MLPQSRERGSLTGSRRTFIPRISGSMRCFVSAFWPYSTVSCLQVHGSWRLMDHIADPVIASFRGADLRAFVNTTRSTEDDGERQSMISPR